MGLATDYCVKWTVLDALKLEFHVHLIEDGCRGVGLNAADVSNALTEMRAAGARLVSPGSGVEAR
jgi:nicotinamidase/pyrazinamidase